MATFKGRDKLLGTYGRYRALFWGLIGVILSIVGFYSVSSAEYPMASYATAMIILMAVWWILATPLLRFLVTSLMLRSPLWESGLFFFYFLG